MTTPAFQEGTYALAYHGAMIYEAKVKILDERCRYR